MDSEARPEIRTQLEQEPSNESRGPSDRAESAPESLADLKTKTEIKKLEAETRVAERALWMPFGSAGLQVVLAFIQGASIILAAYFALAPQITTLKSEVTKQERVLAELGEAVKTASKTVEILHVAINDAGKALDALHQSVRALNMVTNANARQNHLSQILQEFFQNRYMPDAWLKSLEVEMAEFHKDVLSPKEFEQDLAKLKFFIDRDKDMLIPRGQFFTHCSSPELSSLRRFDPFLPLFWNRGIFAKTVICHTLSQSFQNKSSKRRLSRLRRFW